MTSTGAPQVYGPPVAGVTGSETKLTPRADFKPGDFDHLIDAQGARLAWTRAMRCPCRATNDQTSLDPNCPRCLKTPGWLYFGPANYQPNAFVGQLDSIQQRILAEHGAAVIRGVMTGLRQNADPSTRLGPWFSGEGAVSVRAENVLGHRDRLVDLDGEAPYNEVVEVTWSGVGAARLPVPLTTRYLPLGINALFDQDGRRLEQTVDFDLSEAGDLVWRPGRAPAAGTRVGVHYLCHPAWLVNGYPHLLRRTSLLLRNLATTTPLGTPAALPISAVVQLEHLAEAG
jgi:hypothetical protein